MMDLGGSGATSSSSSSSGLASASASSSSSAVVPTGGGKKSSGKGSKKHLDFSEPSQVSLSASSNISEIVLEEVPLASYVHLDQIADGEYIVTHGLSLERLPLQKGHWELVEGETEGGSVGLAGVLSGSGEIQSVVLDDLPWSKRVFQSLGGEMVIRVVRADGSLVLVILSFF